MNKKVCTLLFVLACMVYTSTSYAMEKDKNTKTDTFLIVIKNKEFVNLIRAEQNKTLDEYKRRLVADKGRDSLNNIKTDLKEISSLRSYYDSIQRNSTKYKHISELKEEGMHILYIVQPPISVEKKSLYAISWYISKVLVGSNEIQQYIQDIQERKQKNKPLLDLSDSEKESSTSEDK